MRFVNFRSSVTRAVSHFSAALVIGVLSMQTSYAGPEGGVVRRGDGNIVRPDAQTTNINQHSQNIAIDWRTFNINANETVNFFQPNSTATAYNRILDQSASQIFGAINANGRVILANANGIFFGQSAAVDVGSLIASGLDLDLDRFMDNELLFTNSDGSAGGLIVNHGLLQAAQGGSISLFGGGVENTGTIIANYGNINLAAGEQVTVDFDGDGLINFAVDGEVLENAYGLESAVSNSGTLQATSGRVLLSASAANDVFARVVNNDGVIQASGVTTDGGRVYLTGTGGDVYNTGAIDVSSEQRSGGTVHVLGDHMVGMFGGAVIDASGATGGGEIRIGGGLRGGEGLLEAQRTFIGSSVVISADATVNGPGGNVVVWSDDDTRFYGAVTGRGAGEGSGGFVEISGTGLDFRGDVDLSAANGDFGTLLLDPDDIIIEAGTGDGSDSGGGTNTLDDPTIMAIDTPATYTVYESELEAASADIILEAVNSITTSVGTFTVTLGNGIDITLQTTSNTGAGINIVNMTLQTTGNAGITLIAGSDGGAGTADVSVGTLTTGNRSGGSVTSGSISITADDQVTIAGAVTTGNATANDSATVGLSLIHI